MNEPNQPPPMSTGDKVFLGIFVILLFGGFAGSVLQNFAPVKSAALFFFIAWVPLLVIHELGHAAVARLFGWGVHEVVIGFGKPVYDWRWGPTRFELRSIPIGGHMLPVPPEGGSRRLASAGIYFAGPGAELLVVGLFAMILSPDTLLAPSDHYGLIAIQATCVAALVGAVTNLIPMISPDGTWNDGMGVIVSLFRPDSDFEDGRAGPFIADAQQLIRDNDVPGALARLNMGLEQHPDVPALHILRAELQMKMGERGQALMELRAVSLDSKRSDRCRRLTGEAATALAKL